MLSGISSPHSETANIIADAVHVHEVDKLLPAELERFTPQTITDWTVLRTELNAVRQRGYAVEHEQGTAGVACVAAAVQYRIPSTDAISCSIPAHLANGEPLEKVIEATARHVQRLATTVRREGIR